MKSREENDKAREGERREGEYNIYRKSFLYVRRIASVPKTVQGDMLEAIPEYFNMGVIPSG